MSKPGQRFKQIAFVASSTPEARAAYEQLEKRYGNADPAAAFQEPRSATSARARMCSSMTPPVPPGAASSG